MEDGGRSMEWRKETAAGNKRMGLRRQKTSISSPDPGPSSLNRTRIVSFHDAINLFLLLHHDPRDILSLQVKNDNFTTGVNNSLHLFEML